MYHAIGWIEYSGSQAVRRDSRELCGIPYHIIHIAIGSEGWAWKDPT